MRRRLHALAVSVVAVSLFAGGFPKPLVAQDDPSLRPAPRGIAGDLWADVVVGKRDFAEISPREIVRNKVFTPGGVVVDRSISPGRAYVWDSGNNRILGINLESCYNKPGDSPCDADVVIGQPADSDYGACNLDSSFQYYPRRAPASANTLCGVWEATKTTLEDKSFVGMAVSFGGDLYVPDSRNNRVLKYSNPFNTDVVSDEVWGQADFTGNECNRSQPSPTSETLCFHSEDGSGAGVALDRAGNLWVADGGNHRVLRFRAGSKTADIVLGQVNLVTAVPGAGMDQMQVPTAVRLDQDGKLYVADSGNHRVLVFTPPFETGMEASSSWGRPASGADDEGFQTGPWGLELDPAGRGLWTTDNEENGYGVVKLWSLDGDVLATLSLNRTRLGGSIGIDNQGGILVSEYRDANDVYLYREENGTFSPQRRLFYPPAGYNLTTRRRLEHPGWGGVAIAGNQLIVSDGRLLAWDNPPQGLTNGKSPDALISVDPPYVFGQLKADLDDNVWVTKANEVYVYRAPISDDSLPLKKLQSPLNALGGGQIEFDHVFGLATTSKSEFLWLAEPERHRVFRVRHPLSDNPIVDVVLGQTSLTDTQCNRGLTPARDPEVGLDMLCYPGALAIDRQGNLYVSDDWLEVEGNFRLLMFSSTTFQDDSASLLYAPAATKEFPREYTETSVIWHITFEPAFDSTNRMVVGFNPYYGPRFVKYYDDPTIYDPCDPRNLDYARPDGQLNDYYGWPVAVTFDASDNLYVYDVNRGQVRVYLKPFGAPPDLADLEARGIEFVSLPYAGLPTTANAKLTNVGAAASGVFDVKWLLNDVEVGGGPHASLEPGRQANVLYDWTPTPGHYSLRFVADADDQVLETDETNNDAVMLFQSEAFADLVVRDVEFLRPPEADVLTTVVARLANTGQARSGWFNVKWFVDGVEWSNDRHAPLDVGQTDAVRLEWSPPRGSHTIRFVADVDNNVNETNESNNCAWVTLEL